MAQIDPHNVFQSWVLSPKEILQGSIFSGLQKQYLQNERAKLAHERITLSYDAEHPTKFMQRDAELQGQIGILTYLLEMSESAEKLASPGNQQIIISDGDPSLS